MLRNKTGMAFTGRPRGLPLSVQCEALPLTHFCPPLRFRNQVPTFAVRETARHNGGTSGAPLKPLRDDSALRTLSSLKGLRGTPEVSPLCRETSVSRTANVGTWLQKRNGGQKWVKCWKIFHCKCGICPEDIFIFNSERYCSWLSF